MARTMAKQRFFVGIAILIIMVGFVAIFHSTQQQLDDLRTLEMQCQQQQAILKSRLSAESLKHTQLGQQLEEEKSTNVRFQQHMRQKMQDVDEIKKKALLDSNVRFSSLQQHYKLLNNENQDLKDQCAEDRQKHLVDIESYQGQIKNLKAQVDQLERNRDKVVYQWKEKYAGVEKKLLALQQVVDEKVKAGNSVLATQLLEFQNKEIKEELAEMKRHCTYRAGGPPTVANHEKLTEDEVQRNFKRLIRVNNDTYLIPIQLNSSGPTSKRDLISDRSLDWHHNARNHDDKENSNKNDNVLKEPPSGHAAKVSSSTATLDKMNLRQKDDANKAADPIAMIPTVKGPAAVMNQPKTISQRSRKLPEGVVPIPESMNELLQQQHVGTADQMQIPVGVSDALQLLQNGNEIDTGAHEVDDFNVIEEQNHRHHHAHQVGEGDKVNAINNNAAEVGENKDKNHRHDNDFDLEVINQELQLMQEKENNVNNINNINMGNHHKQSSKKKLDKDKYHEEVAGDQGFDEHLEEQVEEEDDDEYSNLAARHHKEGQAVRD